MKFKVLWFGALFVPIASCTELYCRERSSDMINSCTIVGYISKLAAPDEFELDPVYNKDVIKNLKFINSNLTHIPHGIFTDLDFVENLDLSDSYLVKIDMQAFKFGYNLRELILARNRISVLGDSVFDIADNLERIDLSYNQITTISVNVFKNFKRFVSINLSHNYIKIVSSSIFPAYVSELNLDFNQITKFSVSELTKIDQLTLNNNQLKFLKVNSHLKALQADNNHLESQNLSFNQMNLNSLSLKYNLLANFDVIDGMSNLIYLDLSNNPKNSTPDVFKSLPNLKTLILKSTNLKQSDIELFFNLRNLETLDISSNNLDFIDFNLISRLENLKYLNLNNNNLNSLTFNEFEYLFPKLIAVDISENNWICTDLIGVLKKLKQLQISVEVADVNFIEKVANIRGIRCINITKIVLRQDRDLSIDLNNKTDNAEMNVILTGFKVDNAVLESKLDTILKQLGDSARSVQPNPDIENKLNIIIDQLERLRVELLNTNHSEDALVQYQMNDMETTIVTKIDTSFVKLYDIKVYVMAAIQIVALLFIIIVVFVIYKTYVVKSKDLYNNYNFPTIHCSEPKKDEQQMLC